MGEHVIFNTPPTKFAHFYGCQGAKIREKTPPGPLWNRSHFKADFWEHFCGILVPIWTPFWHQKPPKIDTRKLLIFGVLLDPPGGITDGVALGRGSARACGKTHIFLKNKHIVWEWCKLAKSRFDCTP